MAEAIAQPGQTGLTPASRPLSLIPVGLKEAALDSPTFRATAVHFSDQVEIIEKWLDAYVKSTSRLVHEVSGLEETINTFLSRSVPPANVSEAVLDHDYTLLAMKRFGEGSREWWSQIIGGMKRMDVTVVDPIKSFTAGELRNFKDARRYLEQSQKNFDASLARYLGQSKTKEPSALREDAFQVHEARKEYLKASLDFCILAPQLRSTIDKLLVRVSSDTWREMKRSRELAGGEERKWGSEMQRIRGWSREVEAGENVFRKELQLARREIANAAAAASRPSRELEDYNISTVAFLGSKGPSTLNISASGKLGIERSEKQGWLFLHIVVGKPARTNWVRRWFFVKSGIFGWLMQGATSGGVEESEKIGVLLCNVKPAVQEDRRFCFEVKTKNTTILIQAETQAQLMEWLEAFEIAKNRALEASAKDRDASSGGADLAFSITAPLVPEFAAKTAEGHITHEDGNNSGLATLGPTEMGNLASRSSIDVTTGPRRSVTTREEGESGRDHAARIIQKLDIHRKATPSQLVDSVPAAAAPAAGGIASLISASHNILPVYSTAAITHLAPSLAHKPNLPATPTLKEAPVSTLAPSTLANPPAPTNLSKAAVIVSGERGIGIGHSDATGGMPSGIMANLWGSANWGHVNRLERPEIRRIVHTAGSALTPGSPVVRERGSPLLPSSEENEKQDAALTTDVQSSISTSTDPLATLSEVATSHRKTISLDAEAARLQRGSVPKPDIFPPNYPLALKTQEAQFRMLFPNVPRADKLVMVFRATWNPNEQQEFPGRVYVTRNDMYFYSHHLGLVLINGMSLGDIVEVTAAPGKDCDFIFLHLRPGTSDAGYTRITVKTFLEPLRLLQLRLNFLIDNRKSEHELSLEQLINELVKLETEDPSRSPSMESWEAISRDTPVDNGAPVLGHANRQGQDLRATIHVERGLQSGTKEVTKFQLPSHPVIYEPEDMQRKVIERQYEISPKALFHVMFGDKSAVFQLLYHERRAQRIAQGPWISIDHGHMRRDFHFQIDYLDLFKRSRQANVVDYQVIDVINDHVCYVVTDLKTPWHLPHHKDFMLVSKIVITHVAKSKCKLAVYTRVEWSKTPAFSRGMVEKQALDDLGLDAMDLADVIADQVRKLGPQSRTKKAIQIFGHIGVQRSVSLFSAAGPGHSKRSQIKQQTLTSILGETLASFAESVVSSLVMWTFAVLKGVWKISSANGTILGILAMSVFINLFLSGQNTSEWWAERKAGKFMSRIGIHPNVQMSRAVYLKDMDTILAMSTDDIGRFSNSKWSVRLVGRRMQSLTSFQLHHFLKYFFHHRSRQRPFFGRYELLDCL